MQEAWGAIGKAIRRQRILEGYKSAEKFARHVGINAKTLGTVERGQPVGQATIVQLEDKLGWLPGSIDRVLGGADPACLSRDAAQEVAEVTVKGRMVVRVPVMGRRPEEVQAEAVRVARESGLMVPE